MEKPQKKYWKCTVCNDIHYGLAAPEHCPTCQQDHKFVEVTAEEAAKIMGLNK